MADAATAGAGSTSAGPDAATLLAAARAVADNARAPYSGWHVGAAAVFATDWGELVQVHDERVILQASPDELPVIDIHSL